MTNTAMQMPMMGGMMQMPVMGGMMPQMMGMPMMNGMMPQMMPMPMMMGMMKCTMTDKGMMCEMMPMNDGMKDMFMACCQQMMNMCNMGIPMMVNCGGMSMMCMPMKA